MTPNARTLRYSILALLAAAPVAYGDAGVPLLPIACSGMLLVLVPIVLVEAFVIWRRLSRPFRDCIKASLAANLVSTVAGIPLAWFAMFLMELPFGWAYGLDTWQKRLFAVTAQAAWLIPYEQDLHWMIPAALTFMLIPFFVVSVVLEHRTISRMWKDSPRRSIFFAVLTGNALTYVLLAAVLLWTTVSSTRGHHP